MISCILARHLLCSLLSPMQNTCMGVAAFVKWLPVQARHPFDSLLAQKARPLDYSKGRAYSRVTTFFYKQLTLFTSVGTVQIHYLHDTLTRNTGCPPVAAYLITFRCAAPRCIHNHYPCASHQPATFCLYSWVLLFLIIAFVSVFNFI